MVRTMLVRSGSRALDTPEGGRAELFIASEALVRGELVSLVTSSPDATFGKVVKTPINGDMPFGVVWKSVASGAKVWVVTEGKAYVQFQGTVTAGGTGGIAYMGTATAGRAEHNTSLPAVALHNREIGHSVGTVANGSLTLCSLHFN